MKKEERRVLPPKKIERYSPPPKKVERHSSLQDLKNKFNQEKKKTPDKLFTVKPKFTIREIMN